MKKRSETRSYFKLLRLLKSLIYYSYIYLYTIYSEKQTVVESFRKRKQKMLLSINKNTGFKGAKDRKITHQQFRSKIIKTKTVGYANKFIMNRISK